MLRKRVVDQQSQASLPAPGFRLRSLHSAPQAEPLRGSGLAFTVPPTRTWVPPKTRPSGLRSRLRSLHGNPKPTQGGDPMTHPMTLFQSVSPSSPMHTDRDPRGPVPAPSSPEGGRSPAKPSASAASGGLGRGRRVSRAWEAIPSYRPARRRCGRAQAERHPRRAGRLAGDRRHPRGQARARARVRSRLRHRVIARRAAILLVHNHPSGEEQPSSQDREITTRLREAGQLLGIPLLDHEVVSVAGYHSLIQSTS